MEDQNKRDQVMRTKTDEDGYFKVTVPQGNYKVLVSGRAGYNDAFLGGECMDQTRQYGSHNKVFIT